MDCMIQDLNPGRSKRFFSSTCIDWLLFSGYQGVLPQGLSGQDVRLTTCVPLSAEDKKSWNCTPAVHVCHYGLKSLPLPFTLVSL